MRLLPSSVRGRLLVSLLLPLLAIGVIALFNSYREASAIATSVSDRVLAGSALSIAERVVVTEEGGLDVDIPYAALEMLTSAAQDNVFYRIEGPPGTFITGYKDLPQVADDDDVASEEVDFADREYRGAAVRVAVLRRAGSSGLSAIPFEVTVAETTLARGLLADSILFNAALRLGLLIAAAVVIALVSVSLSIRPLYRLSESIARRSPSELSRIDDVVPNEVRGLVDTINRFMARLGTSLDALRHFTGNASHQLRTPLAIVRTQLALARRAETLQQARAALDEGDQAVVHAERIVAQLMWLARVDEAASQVRDAALVDVAAISRNLTAEMIPRANQVGIDLGYEGEERLMVSIDPTLVGELMRNLIDNALKYSGTGSSVTVRVSTIGDRGVMAVEDTGPGIPEGQQRDLRRRFLRGQKDGTGSGLGLAIVEEIATLFGGALRLETAPGGKGVLAIVEVPLPPELVSQQ